MGEYCALLSLYNMTVEEVHVNVRGREYHGLVYSATDDKGNKVGNPFKSSQFGKSVGYEAVLKKFTRSKQDIKDRKLADMTKRTILSSTKRTGRSKWHMRTVRVKRSTNHSITTVSNAKKSQGLPHATLSRGQLQ